MDLKIASHNILDQLKALIEELSSEDFVSQVSILNGSTVGQHVRHTVEFFKCMIDGVPLGIVNYDKRNHDKSMEVNRSLTMQYIADMKKGITALNEQDSLQLEVNYGLDEATNNIMATNVARELAYNIEHAVHHMAIIKIGVQSVRPDIVLSRDFGVAVSTIRYQESQHIEA